MEAIMNAKGVVCTVCNLNMFSRQPTLCAWLQLTTEERTWTWLPKTMFYLLSTLWHHFICTKSFVRNGHAKHTWFNIPSVTLILLWPPIYLLYRSNQDIACCGWGYTTLLRFLNDTIIPRIRLYHKHWYTDVFSNSLRPLLCRNGRHVCINAHTEFDTHSEHFTKVTF